jgi:hypothetical protein
MGVRFLDDPPTSRLFQFSPQDFEFTVSEYILAHDAGQGRSEMTGCPGEYTGEAVESPHSICGCSALVLHLGELLLPSRVERSVGAPLSVVRAPLNPLPIVNNHHGLFARC